MAHGALSISLDITVHLLTKVQQFMFTGAAASNILDLVPSAPTFTLTTTFKAANEIKMAISREYARETIPAQYPLRWARPFVVLSV